MAVGPVRMVRYARLIFGVFLRCEDFWQSQIYNNADERRGDVATMKLRSTQMILIPNAMR